MPDPISQANLTHPLRFAIQLAEAEGYPECAAGLRAILGRLTPPTDTQADLTERARALVHDICPNDFGQGPCDYPACRDSRCEFWKSGDKIAAALQSEREAAAAEERKKIAAWFERLGRPDVARVICPPSVASPPAPQEGK